MIAQTLGRTHFVTHANVKNAIKPAPIDIQIHTDMTLPLSPVSLLDDPTGISFPPNWHPVIRCPRRFAEFAGSG